MISAVGDNHKHVQLILPWPPSVNSYYISVRNRKVLSKAGMEYRNLLGHDVFEQCPDIHFTTPISVSALLHPPDKRVRDLDNYMKALLDALTINKFWADDSLIDQLHVYRGETRIRCGVVLLDVSDASPVLPYTGSFPR